MTNFKSATLFTVFCVLLVSLPGSPQAAPDKTLGMALMSAVVNEGGSILRGAGVTNVEKPSTGWYQVYFKRSVSGCVLSATLSNRVGMIRAAIIGDHARVFTYDADGSSADSVFYLLVFCTD